MENKNLNEKELEKVTGGQAIIPVIVTEKPDDAAPVGVNRIILCGGCGQPVYCPASGHNTITCSCGYVNRY